MIEQVKSIETILVLEKENVSELPKAKRRKREEREKKERRKREEREKKERRKREEREKKERRREGEEDYLIIILHLFFCFSAFSNTNFAFTISSSVTVSFSSNNFI